MLPMIFVTSKFESNKKYESQITMWVQLTELAKEEAEGGNMNM